MPRKPLDEQHNGRYVKRWLHGINKCRRLERKTFTSGWDPHRYHHMHWVPGDHAVIRHPLMKPLLHKGKKP